MHYYYTAYFWQNKNESGYGRIFLKAKRKAGPKEIESFLTRYLKNEAVIILNLIKTNKKDFNYKDNQNESAVADQKTGGN